MLSKTPKPKIYASDAFDELLNAQRYTASNNWLLSYLDVFILVVMLMVLIVSISDFTKPSQKPKQIAKKVITTQTPRPIIQKHKPALAQPNQKTEKAPAVNNIAAPIFSAVKEAPQTAVKAPVTTDNMAKTPVVIPVPQAISDLEKSQIDEQRLQKELREKVQHLGLDESIHMTISQGFAQLEIQDKVLFKSSEAELTRSGEQLLTRLVPILKESVGIIMIEGHTDDRPINTKRFPSNWELGAARATSVLHFLVSEQLESERLRAISYADTKPIADNSMPEGREKNRRVNIVVKLENR